MALGMNSQAWAVPWARRSAKGVIWGHHGRDASTPPYPPGGDIRKACEDSVPPRGSSASGLAVHARLGLARYGCCEARELWPDTWRSSRGVTRLYAPNPKKLAEILNQWPQEVAAYIEDRLRATGRRLDGFDLDLTQTPTLMASEALAKAASP